MEFTFLLRIFLRFRATLPLAAGAFAWAIMSLTCWSLGVPAAMVASIAGPLAICAATVAWMVDIRRGFTSGLYIDHFEYKRDLAQMLYDQTRISIEQALHTYFAALRELGIAQSGSLFVPRDVKRRYKQQAWVVEAILPNVWRSVYFVEPRSFTDWCDLINTLADCVAAVESRQSWYEPLVQSRRRKIDAVLSEWEERCKLSWARPPQPVRTVAALTESQPFVDIIDAELVEHEPVERP